ncbi:3-oxoacyl-ACP synthase, partial [Streptomyces sp. NPDC004976]
MTAPVAVTGLGLLTPAGEGTDATWDAVCRGVGSAARDPVLAGLPVDFSCRVPLSRDALDRRVGRLGVLGLLQHRVVVVRVAGDVRRVA